MCSRFLLSFLFLLLFCEMIQQTAAEVKVTLTSFSGARRPLTTIFPSITFQKRDSTFKVENGSCARASDCKLVTWSCTARPVRCQGSRFYFHWGHWGQSCMQHGIISKCEPDFTLRDVTCPKPILANNILKPDSMQTKYGIWYYLFSVLVMQWC